MTAEQLAPYLPQVRAWRVIDGKALVRDLAFKDFRAAVAFIDKAAEVAEAEGHHPDLNLHGWNKLTVTLSTHAIGGLSLNDLVLAAKLDELLAA